MPWPRFWGWGEFEAQKKAHLSQEYDKIVQKLEKVELGDNFTPLLARVLLCRATDFERTMTHLPSSVNSFFATKVCFFHNRLSTGIYAGFRHSSLPCVPEISWQYLSLRTERRIPHKPPFAFSQLCASHILQGKSKVWQTPCAPLHPEEGLLHQGHGAGHDPKQHPQRSTSPAGKEPNSLAHKALQDVSHPALFGKGRIAQGHIGPYAHKLALGMGEGLEAPAAVVAAHAALPHSAKGQPGIYEV